MLYLLSYVDTELLFNLRSRGSTAFFIAVDLFLCFLCVRQSVRQALLGKFHQ